MDYENEKMDIFTTNYKKNEYLILQSNGKLLG